MPRRFPPEPRPDLPPLRDRLLQSLPVSLLLGAIVGGVVSLPASATAGAITMLCVTALGVLAGVSPEPEKSNVHAPPGHVLCACCSDAWVPIESPPYRCPECGGTMSSQQVLNANWEGSA